MFHIETLEGGGDINAFRRHVVLASIDPRLIEHVIKQSALNT
jgi:hypothetical protein